MKIQILLKRKKTSVWYDKYFLKTGLYNKQNKNWKKLKLHLTVYWLFLFFSSSYQKEGRHLRLPDLSQDLCMFLCLISSSHFPAYWSEGKNKLNCTQKKKSFALFWLFSLLSTQKIQICRRKRLKITDNPTEIAL